MLTDSARSGTRWGMRPAASRRLLAFAAAGVLAVASCREVTVSAVDVFEVAIDPPIASVEVGGSIRFQATVRDNVGHDLERTIVWSSSAPSVLQVSSTGDALAVGTGAARVTASVEGHSASADVTVKPRPVASVEVIPADVTMLVDDTVSFEAIARDSDGAVLSGHTPVWISGNPGVVSIGVDGRASGVGPGVTTVIADVEGVRGQANVSVRARIVLAVAAVTIVPSTATLAEGDSLDLTAVITAADGTGLTGRTVAWSSSAPGVASVDSRGRVHARAVGTATITASSEGVSGTATLVVTAVPVASVTVSPATATVFVGATLQMQATLRSASGAVLTGRSVTWTSDDPSIVSVNGSGLVTGFVPGSATITASAGGASDNATVFVSSRPVATVSITPKAPNVAVGDPLTLTANLEAGDGSVLTARFVAWSSSNPSVASVASNGPAAQAASLTAKVPGTTLITAVSEGKTDTTTVTVVPKPVATVVIVPGSLTLLEGGTAPLSADVRASDGTLLANEPVVWSSANPTLAAVTGTGPFQQTADVTAGSCLAGQSSCTTTVTATAGGVLATASITVQQRPATVDVVPATAVLGEGATTPFNAVVKDANGTVLPDRAVTWSAVPAGLLSVTPAGPFSQTASVTAGTCPSGTTTCAAKLTAAVGTVSGSANVTITRPAATVSVAPVADTVYEAGQATFTATALASDGTPLPTHPVTWSSSGAPVSLAPAGAGVTVTAGICPAGTPGQCAASITATVDGVPGSATLTILTPVASVNIEPAADTVFELGSTSFAAVLLTAAGDTITGRVVTWASNDSTLALPIPGGLTGTTAAITAGSCAVGVASCSATITAVAEGRAGVATLVVRKAVATVTVKLGADTLFESMATQAVATVLASDGTVITGRTVTWTATQPFATATPAAAPGTAAVTAGACNKWVAGTTDPNADEDCEVTIVATADGVSSTAATGRLTMLKPVAAVTISPRPLAFSGSRTFTADLKAADGAPILNRGPQVHWAVIQGVSITLSASTGQSVVATSLTSGFGTIEARITENGKTSKDTLTLITF